MMETILYVEDDLSLIDGLEYTLETNGYSVDNARTVRRALAMPEGSGFLPLPSAFPLHQGSTRCPDASMAII